MAIILRSATTPCSSATPQGSATTAKRGRLSERAWADVRRAARLARAEGITLKVHGVEITGVLKQPQVAKTRTKRKAQQGPAETAASEQPSTVADEASPPPLSKRKQRSAQRLLEFQEKKRAALVHELVSKGTELSVAQGIVARDERKRLEHVAAQRAAPMEEEANSVEGRPPGSQAAAAQLGVGPKRARFEPPEAG